MKNIVKRGIYGVLYVAILVLSILSSKISFGILFLIMMNIALFEFNRLIKLKSVFPFVLGNLLFFTLCNRHFVQNITINITHVLLTMLVLAIFLVFVYVLLINQKEVVSLLGKIFLSLFYIAIPFTLIVKIPFINQYSTYTSATILGVFILVWTSDTFAYITGNLFGKHKLYTEISPNKSWEGFLGGVVFSLIGGLVLSIIYKEINQFTWLIFAAIISTFGVLGDLIESMFKRQAGVKDSGNIIPGHGGVLDRLDSVILAAPFIFVYLYLIYI